MNPNSSLSLLQNSKGKSTSAALNELFTSPTGLKKKYPPGFKTVNILEKISFCDSSGAQCMEDRSIITSNLSSKWSISSNPRKNKSAFTPFSCKNLFANSIIVGEISDESSNKKDLNNENIEVNKNTEIIDSENEVIELIK